MKNGGQDEGRVTLDATSITKSRVVKIDEGKKQPMSLRSEDEKSVEIVSENLVEKPVEKLKNISSAGRGEIGEKIKKSEKTEKRKDRRESQKRRGFKEIWRKISQKTRRFLKKINLKTVGLAIVVLLGINLVVQILYPPANLLPGTTIAGRNFGFMNKAEVARQLGEAYADTDIDIFFGDNELPHSSVKPSDIGLTVKVSDTLNQFNYPWYMRLVPTSIFWYGALSSSGIQPELSFNDSRLNTFIISEFGVNCSITPENASLFFEGRNLKLKKAKYGGDCKTDDVRSALKDLKFDSTKQASVRIPMDTIKPDITNSDAKNLASAIGTKLLKDLPLVIESEQGDITVDVSPDELVKWIEFEVVDKKLTVVISDTKSAEFFEKQVAPLVSRAAGVSVVTASNLGDIDHNEGAKGKMINIKETNQRIADWLMDKRTSVTVAIESIDPDVQYARRFDSSSEGLSALITYFAQTHQGRYGVQVFEIGNRNRHASYYADREFEVGGAARFIVGYGLLGVDNAEKNNDACFNSVMRSYNIKCVDKTVFSWLLQNKARIGIANTTISTDTAKSTAYDLAAFLVNIYNNNSGLSGAQNNKIMAALQSSEPRDGIASLGSHVISSVDDNNQRYSDVVMTTANNNPYVLAILTENASKSDVIELAKKVNELMGN